MTTVQLRLWPNNGADIQHLAKYFKSDIWCIPCITFYHASNYASTVLAAVIRSVCLSLRHRWALWQNQTMHCGYFDTTRKGNHSSFLTPTVVGMWRPLPSKICTQKWPTPFEKLRQISAYNVSSVRDSEKSLIMTDKKSTRSFSTSYRLSVQVTPKSPKGWLKKRIFVVVFKK